MIAISRGAGVIALMTLCALAAHATNASIALQAAIGILVLSFPVYMATGWGEADVGAQPVTAPPPSRYGPQQTPQPAVSPLPVWLAVLAVFCWLADIGVVVWLRGRVRAQSGIPGHVFDDALSMLPLMCCCPCQGYARELAVMDRQLTPGVIASPDAPRAVTSRPRWTTTLCGCNPSLTGDCPQFNCAIMCPWFIQLRVLYRLGKGSLKRALGLIALQTLVPLVILAAVTFTHAGAGWQAFANLLIATNILGSIVSVYLRTSVRERYGIPGTISDDAILAVCCPACSLAQLERETAPALEIAAAAGGAAAGGPVGGGPSPSGAPKAMMHVGAGVPAMAAAPAAFSVMAAASNSNAPLVAQPLPWQVQLPSVASSAPGQQAGGAAMASPIVPNAGLTFLRPGHHDAAASGGGVSEGVPGNPFGGVPLRSGPAAAAAAHIPQWGHTNGSQGAPSHGVL